MSKIELTQSMRRNLRASAHALHPVVMIGDKGLTDTVIAEIDHSLTAHELIKIRVAGDDRSAREEILNSICEQLECEPIQHLGKILIVYRPNAKDDASEPAKKRKSEPYIPKKQAAAKKQKH